MGTQACAPTMQKTPDTLSLPFEGAVAAPGLPGFAVDGVTQRHLLVAVALRVVGAVVIILPSALGARFGFFAALGNDPASAFAYWGSFAIYLWTKPSSNECLLTIALGLLLRVVHIWTLGPPGSYVGDAIIGNGTYLGIASVVVLFCTVNRADGEERTIKRRALLASSALINLNICLGFALRVASALCPEKRDLWLYAIDESFGQPSFLLGRLFAQSKVLWAIETTVYFALPLALSIFYAAHEHSRQRWPISIFRAITISCLLVFVGYVIYPAAGPAHAFPGFPYSAPAQVPEPRRLALSAWPNCMPSLHMAGALLVWWNARPWFWARMGAGVFALLTALATLGTGEHYLIDLVVAVPYALAIQGAAANHPRRVTPLLAGTGLTAAWLALLHLDNDLFARPPLIWTLTIATLGVSLLLERRLAHAVFGRPDRGAAA
jgi:hypothetical protein